MSTDVLSSYEPQSTVGVLLIVILVLIGHPALARWRSKDSTQ